MTEALIDHARLGTSIGELLHVNIDIKHRGKDCNIKEIVKPSRVARIRIGQNVQAFVKVTVPRLKPSSHIGTETPQQQKPGAVLDDLMQMLGESETKMFTVEISYKHSLLPDKTWLTSQVSCSMHRSNNLSIWSLPHQGKGHRGRQDANKINYGKAMFIAQNWPPEAAIRRMQCKFKADLLVTGHECGIHYIMEELMFQQRLKDRVSVLGGLQVSRDASPADEHGSSRAMNLHISDTSRQKQHMMTRHGSDGRAHEPHGPQQEPDKAREIWRHMRRDSRSISLLSNNSVTTREGLHSCGSLDGLEAADDHLREIRRQALLNKRSVGVDTLREMWLDGTMGRVPAASGAGPEDENWL